jgi:hypothetical protein
MNARNMNFKKVALLIGACAALISAQAQTIQPHLSGTVLDPSGRPVAQAHIEFDTRTGQRIASITGTGPNGVFSTSLPAWGAYSLHIEAAGFEPMARTLQLNAETSTLTFRFEKVSAATEDVIVNGDVSEIALEAPDPSQKVLVREQLLDANPGRPGAPISIPGLPIETAAGGIKAPQYLRPA